MQSNRHMGEELWEWECEAQSIAERWSESDTKKLNLMPSHLTTPFSYDRLSFAELGIAKPICKCVLVYNLSVHFQFPKVKHFCLWLAQPDSGWMQIDGGQTYLSEEIKHELSDLSGSQASICIIYSPRVCVCVFAWRGGCTVMLHWC